MENKVRNRIIDFFKSVGFVILLMLLVFLVIISLGLVLVFLDCTNIKEEYKDDLTLTREWIREHERKI